jgi:hypothetical protein
MKQSNNNELKVNILGGHGLQTRDQIIKKWGKVHGSTMYMSSFSIFILQVGEDFLVHINMAKALGEKPLLKKQLIFYSFDFMLIAKCFPNTFDIFTILNVCKLCIHQMFTK